MHYARWKRHGDPAKTSRRPDRPLNMTLAEFCEWARRERTRWFHGCELWTGAKRTGGYGHVTFGGRTRSAHALIAEHYHGPAPNGRPFACHICHNPACINPAHLYWGTPRDNVRDKEAAGRGNPPKGERHGNAKLTALRVRLIRRLAARGAPQSRLAGWLGVSSPTVSAVVTRRSWRHV